MPTYSVFRYAKVALLALPKPITTSAPRLATAEPYRVQQADTLRVDVTFDIGSPDSAAPVSMTMRLPLMADTAMLLQLPNSTAGRSQLYENIVALHVTTPGARLVATDRPDRVLLLASRGVMPTLAWRLRATARSYSSDNARNHSDIGAGWAQIVGYDALIFPAIDRATPLHALFHFRNAPAGGAIATSFGPPDRDSTVIACGTINDIRNAVYDLAIVPAAVRAYHTTESGGDVTVLVRGRHAIDDSLLAARVRRVIAEERRFWGGDVPQHYLVTIGVAPRGSLDGVRLTNAFVADIDSTQALDERVTGLFAHELMHVWVGGVLHPASSVPSGQLYWFTEGFDDFIAHRLMHTVGLLSDSGYAAAINRDLRAHALSSARDSSWDALVHGFWNDNAMSGEVYRRGELVALTLDAQMRQATHGGMGVDSLLRVMARDRALRRSGLTADTIFARAGAVLGADVARRTVEQLLAGGAISLPDGALGPCMKAATSPSLPARPGVSVQVWSAVACGEKRD